MIAKRYFNFPYVWHTLRIKLYALLQSNDHLQSPYFTYCTGIQISDETIANFTRLKPYISLLYWRPEEVGKVLTKSLIHDIMRALIMYNKVYNGTEREKSDFLARVDAIIHKGSLEEDKLKFYYTEEYKKFDLSGKYISGIVQAKAASLFLRAYDISKDAYYRDMAEKAIMAMLVEIECGGSLRRMERGLVWVEEYPSPNPSMVLNGHIFGLIALAEYLSIQENDYLNVHFQKLHQTTIAILPIFRRNKFVLYSLYRWSFSNINYLGVHAFQFQHLYKITNDITYRKWAHFTKDLCDWKLFAQIRGIPISKLKQRLSFEN